MLIGTSKISKCNECPAYIWSGECQNKGDHGHRCDFGAFDSWYDGTHPIPEDCPIKASDISHIVANKEIVCYVCGWKGKRKELVDARSGVGKVCPDCLCDIEV